MVKKNNNVMMWVLIIIALLLGLIFGSMLTGNIIKNPTSINTPPVKEGGGGGTTSTTYATYQGVLNMLNKCELVRYNSDSIHDIDNDGRKTANDLCLPQQVCITATIGDNDNGNIAYPLDSIVNCGQYGYPSGMAITVLCCKSP